MTKSAKLEQLCAEYKTACQRANVCPGMPQFAERADRWAAKDAALEALRAACREAGMTPDSTERGEDEAFISRLGRVGIRTFGEHSRAEFTPAKVRASEAKSSAIHARILRTVDTQY